MTRIGWIALFVFVTGVCSAQQTPPSTEHTVTIPLQPKTPLNDPSTLVSAVQGSYYHPDSLNELDCDIGLDWPAFFASLKTEIPPERLKIIQALKMKVKAQRGRTAEVTFDWGGGAINGGQQQMENGLKQMVSGYFQFYWPMAATTLIASPSEITKSEAVPYGGTKIYTSAPGGSLVISVDKDYAPTKYVIDTTALKATMTAQYLPSPNPVPGDLRRISHMDISEQIGTSNINAGLGFDYQTVDEFVIPKHVLFDVSGAYSLNMEFSGCVAMRDAAAPAAKEN